MRRKQAEAIEEGVSIALAAARLAVKNQILVGTIAADASFDVDRFVPVAQDALRALAAEAGEAADRIRRAGRAAWGRHSEPDGTHDYRDRDVRNLRRRRKQSEGVARELTALADDVDRVRELVEASREAAWTDVASNLDRRLRVEGMRPDADPDYESMREARMQALRLVDLSRLAAQVKAREAAQE